MNEYRNMKFISISIASSWCQEKKREKKYYLSLGQNEMKAQSFRLSLIALSHIDKHIERRSLKVHIADKA